MPPVDAYANRGGRFGAHNLYENTPSPNAWFSDQIILGTFFNGGLRAYDISNPYQPKEVGAFVPPAPPLSPADRSSSTTCSSTSARSSTRSTASPAGCTSWRWISDGMLDLFPSRDGRAVRAAAAARARGAHSGHRRHRLSRRRQDHAAAALPRHAGGRRHRGRRQRVRRGRHRRCAAAREQRRDRAARQRLRVLHHAHRPADRAARPGGRPRARPVPHFRRVVIETSGLADPGPLLQTFATDRALGGEFSVERGARGRRRGQRARNARLVGGGAQAGHPGRPPRRHQDRPRRSRRDRAPHARLAALNPRAAIETAVNGALDPRRSSMRRPIARGSPAAQRLRRRSRAQRRHRELRAAANRTDRLGCRSPRRWRL